MNARLQGARGRAGRGTLILAVMFLAQGVPPVLAQSPVAGTVVVANVTDRTFAVTWMTDTASKGQVQLTTGESFSEAAYPDGRGADFSGRTHFVLVRNLQPATPYTFDLVSGGRVDDNGGNHYAVTTAPTLPVAPGQDVFTGQVKNPNGTYAGDALILFRIQLSAQGTPVLSQWLAAPVAPDPARYFGEWTLTLRPGPRAADLATYLAYNKTTDKVTLQANGATGMYSGILDAGAPRYGTGFVVDLAGTAVTATPTRPFVQPTATPVPTRTPTPQASATFTRTPTAEPDTPTRPPAATRPSFTATRPPASPTPSATPEPTEEPTETPAATQVAAAEAATLAPEPVATRAPGIAERLAGPALFLIVAVLAFGFAVFFIILAFYFWRRQM